MSDYPVLFRPQDDLTVRWQAAAKVYPGTTSTDEFIEIADGNAEVPILCLTKAEARKLIEDLQTTLEITGG